MSNDYNLQLHFTNAFINQNQQRISNMHVLYDKSQV